MSVFIYFSKSQLAWYRRGLSMAVPYDYYRLFYYVAKYHSFTRTAEILMNSQPNITSTMNNLENALGCQLFSVPTVAPLWLRKEKNFLLMFRLLKSICRPKKMKSEMIILCQVAIFPLAQQNLHYTIIYYQFSVIIGLLIRGFTFKLPTIQPKKPSER